MYTASLKSMRHFCHMRLQANVWQKRGKYTSVRTASTTCEINPNSSPVELSFLRFCLLLRLHMWLAFMAPTRSEIPKQSALYSSFLK